MCGWLLWFLNTVGACYFFVFLLAKRPVDHPLLLQRSEKDGFNIYAREDLRGMRGGGLRRSTSASIADC